MARGKRYGGTYRYLLGRHGWPMHHQELREHMVVQGLLKDTGKIPKDVSFTTYVAGTDGVPVQILVTKSTGRMGRRVWARCPECGDEVCAGHLHQHVAGVHPDPVNGTLRIDEASPYGHEGFVVEQFSDRRWAVPGWIEDRWGESGFFPDRASAERFVEMVSPLPHG